jgi:Tfp pilus assembly protein PilP
MTMRPVFVAVLLAVAPGLAAAQTTTAAPPAVQQDPAVEDGYTYRPAGRRDPFLNLRNAEVESATPQRRGTGLAALMTDELSVRGVVKSAGVLLAMVKGPDTKTYVVHVGDTLADGTITAVTADGLVIAQAVADPLSKVKQREVHKSLRMAGDTKE